MHPLTKMFIVLQAILSVLVAALVIPYAVNEDSWKGRYEAQDVEIQAAYAAQRDAETALGRIDSEHSDEIAALSNELTQRQTELDDLRHQLVQLRTERDEAMNDSARIESQIATLSSTAQTHSNIIASQADEIRTRREESLRLKQRAIDLEDQLRDVSSQLEVSVDAQRLLQERIERLREQLEGGVASGADTGTDTAATIPSPPVVGRVLRLEQTSSGDVFAEVDLGSRDGLAEGMKFLISRDGLYKATLVITNVDINRSSGRLEIVTGEVQPNDLVRGTGGVTF